MVDGISRSFLQLVVGLTPPGRRHPDECTASPRERSVLFALAYLADESDDEGWCCASVRDLSAMTHHRPTSVRAALRSLEYDGWLTSGTEAWSTKTYRLRRDRLERAQFTVRAREDGAVEALAEYGLSARAISALTDETDGDSCGYRTVGELGEVIAAYRNLLPSQQEGFHRWLGVPLVGEVLAREIVVAYDAWATGQQRSA